MFRVCHRWHNALYMMREREAEREVVTGRERGEAGEGWGGRQREGEVGVG